MLYLSTTGGVHRVDPANGRSTPLGPDGQSTEALAVNGDEIVAALTPPYGRPMRDPLLPAADGGLVVSHDAGATWQRTGIELGSPHVSALGASPMDGRVFFAGTDPAEVYLSRDGGRSWQATMPLRSLPGYERWSYPLPPHSPHVMWFAPHPQEPSVVYAGVEVGGLVRSGDYGQNWEQVGDGLDHDVHGLTVCRARPHVMYAATPKGVYVSTDAGRSWERRVTGLSPIYCRPIAVHPENADIAFTVTTRSASGFFGVPPEQTGTSVYRTRDAGMSWLRLRGGLPDALPSAAALAINPSRPETVYLGDFSGQLWASADLGERWHVLAEGLPPVLRMVVAGGGQSTTPH